MDELKKYLAEQREVMDADTPGEKVWTQIDAHFSPAVKMQSFFWRYAAACALLIVALGTWLLWKPEKQPIPPEVIVQEPANVNPGNKVSAPTDLVQTATAPTRKNIEKKSSRAKHTALPYARHSATTDAVAFISNSYESLITFQLSRLRTTPVYAEGPDYFALFTQQLKQIDNDEQVIRKDIRRYGLTDELLTQLINVYQQKLNVLKTLQSTINKMNNKVRAQSTTAPAAYFYLNI